MKIIKDDNLGRDHKPQELVAENVCDFWATKIVKLLNDNCDDEDYFCVVENDYQIREREED